jgi:hypothetical protein
MVTACDHHYAHTMSSIVLIGVRVAICWSSIRA